MRLVGILLALLAAATLLWAAEVPILIVPTFVNFRIQVFEGANFKKISGYNQRIDDVFEKARSLFKIFTDSYGTTFTLTRLDPTEWDDASISFDDLQAESGKSNVENVHLYVYFANNEGYTGIFRNGGLKGKVCDANKGFKTLLLNGYRSDGVEQDETALARMMVYYAAKLLGMKEDVGLCAWGLMSAWYFWTPTWKRTWNVCNAKQLVKGYNKARVGEARCAVTLFDAKPNDAGVYVFKIREAYAVRRLSIPLAAFINVYNNKKDANEIIGLAEGFLNKDDYKLGVEFNLYVAQYVDYTGHGLSLKMNLKDATVEAKPYSAKAKFFLFFTDLGIGDMPQQADWQMNNKFCDDDITYRTFIFDRKDWGADGQLSKDGVAKQLAYFIGRSMGIRYDEPHRCAFGFMHVKNRRDIPGNSRKDFIDHWNRDSAGVTWNMCSVAEMFSATEKKDCLKKSLVRI